MSHIPDPIERGEASAERIYEEMIQPDGMMKCFCGEIFDYNKEGGFIHMDPYAPPFCGKCCEEHVNS